MNPQESWSKTCPECGMALPANVRAGQDVLYSRQAFAGRNLETCIWEAIRMQDDALTNDPAEGKEVDPDNTMLLAVENWLGASLPAIFAAYHHQESYECAHTKASRVTLEDDDPLLESQESRDRNWGKISDGELAFLPDFFEE